jgi:hypothetical protein
LPHLVQEAVLNVLHNFSGVFAAAAALGLSWIVLSTRRNVGRSQASLYLFCCTGFALYFLMASFIVKFVALDLSSKVLAEKALPFIDTAEQIVIYDNFRSSLPYYLDIRRPMWIVWPGKGASIMESFYIAERQPQPSAAYGKALMSFDEFSRLKETTRKNLLVFVKAKSARKLTGKNGLPPQKLLEINDCVLLSIAGSDGKASK